MSRSTKLLAGLAFAATLGAAIPASAATIIQDGNFDVPPAVNPFLTQFGGATFGGVTNNVWQVLGHSVDVVGNYWSAPVAGGGSVDLDGEMAGGLSQAFTTAAGEYKLSFYLSGNPDGGPSTKSVAVSVGNVSSQLFTYDVTGANSHSNMDYVLETLIFTSTGGGDILTFLSQDALDNSFGAVIGGISISSVPEPATWMMLILGFGLTGSLLRLGRTRRPALLA
ncbi:MAG TPA: PEPxxWA-CTERM sorting domain-containing protein [Rhizomicrobium sp.]|nr:PEPxxWA-CTERM sorting domain-containing protein [Rhizomicrobium sp.]